MSRKQKPMKQVTIYTDGACKGNPGSGGWGAVLEYGGSHRLHLAGGEPETTNNRMELKAAIEGLKALKEPCNVLVVVDSQYVMKGVQQWINGWKRNGWKTAAGQPVKNQDLWIILDALTDKHQIRWQWVKGHSGHPGNELADRLANDGASGKVLHHYAIGADLL